MTVTDALTALGQVRLEPTLSIDAIWSDDIGHAHEIHKEAHRRFLRSLEGAEQAGGVHPMGLVLQGNAGVGKTHLLGACRRACAGRAIFVSVDINDVQRFWSEVALRFARSLLRVVQGRRQLHGVLDDLGRLLSWPDALRESIARGEGASRAQRDDIVRAFRIGHRDAHDAHEALRALLLFASADPDEQDLGDAWLQSLDFTEDLVAEGFRQGRTPREVVERLSGLIALVRPQVIAFDQLDPLIAGFGNPEGIEARTAMDALAAPLMSLRDTTQRALTVLSCTLPTWIALERGTLPAFKDRFERVALEVEFPDAEGVRRVVAARLGAAYAAVGFTPPYDTWPIHPEAFQKVDLGRTPRSLLRAVAEHIQRCVDRREVLELKSLAPAVPVTGGNGASGSAVAHIDALFAEKRAAADVSGILDHDHEDVRVPEVLRGALSALAVELQAPGDALSVQDDPPSQRSALHAVLERVLDPTTDRKKAWCFRAIGHSNARAAIARLTAAGVAAGIENAGPDRFLVLLRNSPWPLGPRTAQVMARLEQLACRTFGVSDADLRTFVAVRALAERPPAGFREWLVARRPVSQTYLFRKIVSWAPFLDQEAGADAAAESEAVETGAEVISDDPATEEAPASSVPIGTSVDGAPVALPLSVLSRHTVLFAGSGSGKTVLVRRMVEEAALQGVSSIVLDTNNDLARLGDAWPEPPQKWLPGDAQRATEYLAKTEVIVWTPRRASGRPLAFQPLPDFGAVRDNLDLLQQAIDGAVATLAPRAALHGQTARAQRGQAVLRVALQRFAGGPGVGFDGFLTLLRNLPAGVALVPFDTRATRRPGAGAAQHASPTPRHSPARRANRGFHAATRQGDRLCRHHAATQQNDRRGSPPGHSNTLTSARARCSPPHRDPPARRRVRAGPRGGLPRRARGATCPLGPPRYGTPNFPRTDRAKDLHQLQEKRRIHQALSGFGSSCHPCRRP